MKTWLFVGLLAFAGVFLTAFAEESGKDVKPEYAWDSHHHEGSAINGGSKYVYGYITVPRKLLNQLTAGGNETDDDPFGGDSEEQTKPDSKTMLRVPANNLPQCLPRGRIWLDISKLFLENGVNIKKPEWALYSELSGDEGQLYFCTTWGNADLISCIFTALRAGGPRSIHTCATLVSVENQGLNNTEWTMEALTKAKPTVHARFGTQSRSGERSTISICSDNPTTDGQLEMDSVIGENNRLLDCRMSFSYRLAGQHTAHINLDTAFTGIIGTPFIIEHGNAGDSDRHYLLVVETRLIGNVRQRHDVYHILDRMDKIEGRYAMRDGKKEAPQNHQPEGKIETHLHRCPSNLLAQFESNYSELASEQQLSPPKRVKSPPTPPANQLPAFPPNDLVYDITPHLKAMGYELGKQEWIYHNATHHHLIIHATKNTRLAALSNLEDQTRSSKMLRLTAKIIRVSRPELNSPLWTTKEIIQRKPEILATYAATSRSGETAHSGQEHTRSTKDPETGKVSIKTDYTFEVETTLGENNQMIDVRLQLQHQPNNKPPHHIKLLTALTLQDGKPTIIELGQPNSRKHTHLLLLNSDIITPDGSFYRDRFKPVE